MVFFTVMWQNMHTKIYENEVRKYVGEKNRISDRTEQSTGSV